MPASLWDRSEYDAVEGVILTSPPQASATQTSSPGVPVFEMMRDAPALPPLQADTI
jgi:hypothetical protein